MSLSDNLKTMTNDQLAGTHRVTGKNESMDLLCKAEWKRRALVKQHNLNIKVVHEQHKLNEQLFEKQSKLTITIAKIGAGASILAALIGTGFGFFLKTTMFPETSQLSPKMETTISATISPKTQTEPALINASSPNPTLNQTTKHGAESGKVTNKERTL